MSMTVSGLTNWRPGALNESAAALRRVRASVEDAESNLTTQISRLEVVWQSEGGTAAALAARRHRDRLREVSENLGLAARALASGGEAFQAARDLLVRARDVALDNDGVMGEDGSVQPPPEPVFPVGVTVMWSPSAHAAKGSACADAQTMAREALRAATEADRDAARALRALTAEHRTPGRLAGMVGAIETRAVPRAGTDPERVAAWWASLTDAERERLIEVSPGRIGNLDGVPAAFRDRANRAVLADALAAERAEIAALQARLGDPFAPPDPFGRPELLGPVEGAAGLAMVAAKMALASAKARLAMLEAIDRQLRNERGVASSLYQLDTSMPGLAVIGFGDLDTARNVAVLVPGMGSHVTNYMGAISNNAARLAVLADDIELGNSDKTGATATLAWIGYNAPSGAQVATAAFAEAGAPKLAATLNGLQAVHGVQGNDPHLTVLGHSYGSLVSGMAASGEAGHVPVDDWMLFGSPVGLDNAGSFGVGAGHVYVGEAKNEFVADLNAFGPDPARMPGVTTFQTDGGFHPLADGHTLESTGHSEYYRANSESLWNIASVVTDRPENLTTGTPLGFGDVLRTQAGLPLDVARGGGSIRSRSCGEADRDAPGEMDPRRLGCPGHRGGGRGCLEREEQGYGDQRRNGAQRTRRSPGRGSDRNGAHTQARNRTRRPPHMQ